MIRINLLPFRAARKRENIKRQITIYALVLLLSLAIIGYGYVDLSKKVNQLKEEEEKVTKELATYQKELDEIKRLEKMIKEIKTKLDVIKTLEKGKSGPVLLLADVADAVPKDKLWLNSFKESKGSLTLTGTAMDNETVSLFMQNLKETEHITSVDLQKTVSRDIKEYNLKVSDFILKCKTYAAETKKKKAPKKK
jgi:type IV pilus assembly protein PilN